MNNKELAADLRERADRLAAALEQGADTEGYDYQLALGLSDIAVTCEMVRSRHYQDYRFEHISDLLKLHDHHIDDFCEELPTMIRSVKATLELITLAAGELTENLPEQPNTEIDLQKLMPYITWQADGVDEVICTLKQGDEPLGTLHIKND